MLNHVQVAHSVLVTNSFLIHHIVHSIEKPLVNLVNVGTQLLELNAEGLLVVGHVEEGARRSVDETILLPDCENVFL